MDEQVPYLDKVADYPDPNTPIEFLHSHNHNRLSGTGQRGAAKPQP